MKKQTAPRHLSAESRRWWNTMLESFEIDDAGAVALLTVAAESLDRRDEARRTLKVDGSIITDRFGGKRPHPSIAIERDAAATFMRALRNLGLDIVPPNAGPGRPPGIR